MPRVAVLSYHTSPLARLGGRETGGMNVYVRESALELGRLGHAVDIFTRDDGTTELIQDYAPNVRVIALTAGPRNPLEKEALAEHLPAFLNALRHFRETQGLRYDVVHSHYWMSSWVGRHLQRLWDVPHVAMFHTLGEVKRRARAAEQESEQRIDVERLAIRSADRVIAASTHEKGLLMRLYGARDRDVSVVPCGVDLARFRPQPQAAARTQTGLPTDGRIVLFVGRLEPLKGVEVLIDAVGELEDSAPLLVIIGGDERAAAYIETLRVRAARLGIANRTRFLGAVPQESLVSYYNAADLCVVPSYYESFGLVALEAMACGTPVIASRVGGLVGTVRDGETGFLIPWRCPQPFADKIDLLLTNDELRDRFSAASVAAAARFEWSTVSAEISTLYATVIGERLAAGCHGRHATVGASACHG